jgi:hypothetical protein
MSDGHTIPVSVLAALVSRALDHPAADADDFSYGYPLLRQLEASSGLARIGLTYSAVGGES